jgi:hypothetical protein
MNCVLQDWVMRMNWKQQSILLSSLRGPDVPNVPNIKIVNRWMRRQCQRNADPSKNYMTQSPLPMPIVLCDELEFLTVHYVHHLADGLAVIAYNHPDQCTAVIAARFHYRIAEELFHFAPELPEWFALRHVDRSDPSSPHPFHEIEGQQAEFYIKLVNDRFSPETKLSSQC